MYHFPTFLIVDKRGNVVAETHNRSSIELLCRAHSERDWSYPGQLFNRPAVVEAKCTGMTVDCGLLGERIATVTWSREGDGVKVWRVSVRGVACRDIPPDELRYLATLIEDDLAEQEAA